MKFFRRIGDAFHTKIGAYVFFALSAGAFVFLRSAEWAYGWIANLYPLGEKFVPTVFCIIGFCVALTFLFFVLPEKIKGSRAARITHTVSCVLTGVLFVYTAVLLFGLDKGFDLPSMKGGVKSLIPELPLLCAAIGLSFVFLLRPALKKTARVVTAVVVSIAVLMPIVLIQILPDNLKPFTVSANPLVLDIGSDNYSVVFATNRKSTAYLTYTTPDGEEVTLPDAVNGTMKVRRVHSFTVPRRHLNGGSYSFTAREVISAVISVAEFGATLKSEVFNFKGEYQDALNILIASDWHNMPKNLLAAAGNFPEADLFLMLGDYSSNYNDDDELIIDTIKAGADVTKSAIPSIFARGNHEMSGEKAEMIFTELGLDSFYYQVRRGNYLFTVCDSADDWAEQRTSTEEYVSGTVNSESGVYREEQLDWLKSLDAPEENIVHFAAVHIPNFDEENEDKQNAFFDEMQRLNARMQFSGHAHSLSLYMPGDDSEYTVPYPLLIDGGPKDGGYSGTYVCSMAQIKLDGTVRLTAFDSDGEQLLDKTLALAIN